ncbi:MAG: CPBP family intramembrane metalloprotease [Deltaproteobacteria bacterium]|nr:CPBP family intramembrane metalloprotease [Deltaproteobacteria bacterium]
MKSAAIATAIFLSASALDLVGYGFTYWPGMKLWLTFCFINIFVSLFEEFLFRGLLLNSLVDLFAARTAVLISAALFAAYHFGVTPPQAWPGHVAFGLVMGFALAILGSTGANFPSFWPEQRHIGGEAQRVQKSKLTCCRCAVISQAPKQPPPDKDQQSPEPSSQRPRARRLCRSAPTPARPPRP